MAKWKLNIQNRTGHQYRRIAEAIREAVDEGALISGEKLPPHRTLAWDLGVTVATVARGYNLAMQWGLLVSHVGSGTHVATRDESTQGFTLSEPAEMINMGLLLPVRLSNKVLAKRAFEAPLADVGVEWASGSNASYAPELGFRAHREAGAFWLSDGEFSPSPDQTVICHGAQEAFVVLISTLTKPGDIILLEAMAYLGLKAVCDALKRRVHPVPMDDEGIIPEALDEEARKTKARLLFITPYFQNPTGVCMTERRKQQIAEIAKNRNLYIVEDDALSRLSPQSKTLPLAVFAPKNCFYVVSLSKLAAPAVRVAYLVAPVDFIARIEVMKHALAIGGTSIQAALATRWIRHDIIKDLISFQQKEITKRHRYFKTQLAKVMLRFTDDPYCPFIWAALPDPLRASDFVRNLKRKSVISIDAERFSVGRAIAPHYVRFALTTSNSFEQFKMGVDQIKAELIADVFDLDEANSTDLI
jgi:DNA-binding transcriptional MocR family regulator